MAEDIILRLKGEDVSASAVLKSVTAEAERLGVAVEQVNTSAGDSGLKKLEDEAYNAKRALEANNAELAQAKQKALDAAKLEPAKAKYLVGYDPTEAKKLLTEAGYGKGLTVPMYHWPGYVVPWRSYYELTAENLGKVGITVELKPEEYGKYSSTTMVGKYEKMAMGPSTPFTEVDDFLFARFAPELPTNLSHVTDAELTKMLVAQRREMDPKKRKQIVDDIQRYLADDRFRGDIVPAGVALIHAVIHAGSCTAGDEMPRRRGNVFRVAW